MSQLHACGSFPPANSFEGELLTIETMVLYMPHFPHNQVCIQTGFIILPLTLKDVALLWTSSGTFSFCIISDCIQHDKY